MITAEQAMAKLYEQPLEMVERTGDETLRLAADVLGRSVEREEISPREAVMIAFAAGAYFATMNSPADPPTGGASGS